MDPALFSFAVPYALCWASSSPCFVSMTGLEFSQSQETVQDTAFANQLNSWPSFGVFRRGMILFWVVLSACHYVLSPIHLSTRRGQDMMGEGEVSLSSARILPRLFDIAGFTLVVFQTQTGNSLHIILPLLSGLVMHSQGFHTFPWIRDS